MNRTQRIATGIASIAGVLLVFLLGYSIRGLTTAGRGLCLPPGDPAAGEAAFIELHCSDCHSVVGGAAFTRPDSFTGRVLPLGGEVGIIKSQGELVTAILHPGAQIRTGVSAPFIDAEGRSIMPNYLEEMTPRQLVDLVAYLQIHYELAMPGYQHGYYPYGMGVEP